MNLHINYVCLLFLCIFPNKIGTLLCIINTISRFQLQNFNVDHFRETIHSLHTEEYGYGTVCQIQLYKVYTELTIRFGDDITLSVPLKDGEIHFDTELNMDILPAMGAALEHLCSKRDECDRHFVLNHTPWLIQQNHSQLQANIRPLLMKKTIFSGQCFIDYKNTSQCSNPLCTGIYSTNNDKYEMKCTDHERDTPTIYITTYIIPIPTNSADKKSIINTAYEETQIIKYNCNYKHCNSRNITDQIWKIVKAQYNLSSIRSILNYVYKEPTTTTSLATPFSKTFSSTRLSTLSKMSSFSDDIDLTTNFVSYTTDVTIPKTTITVQYSPRTLQEESTDSIPSSTNVILTNLESAISFSSQTTNFTQYQSSITYEYTSITNYSGLSSTMTSGTNRLEECFSMHIYLIVWITLTSLKYWIDLRI